MLTSEFLSSQEDTPKILRLQAINTILTLRCSEDLGHVHAPSAMRLLGGGLLGLIGFAKKRKD